MKSIKILMFGLALLAVSTAIISCGGSGETKEATEEATTEGEATMEAEMPAAEEAVDMTGPEYTSAYVCPMHCKGSGSAEPGKCPVCGMDYVMNENAGGGDGHEGHNH